ncbi:NAD(P) transhydrogenase subunit alpha [Skermanella mucosa]|uniref:NAD(P) transhydrogenase subunit alpha n=1 Tax=Skermanella mucosa TaxID=1789672 RepID=UPI00192B67D8|nr:NAD(P) transhydrogenase subunit alpha [Skermanella mucosa]UEM22239.1 NAD(P) transhydrogenase subunit alpha [Skermanella mucosa]
MTSQELAQQVTNLQQALRSLTIEADRLAAETSRLAAGAVEQAPADHSFFITGLTVFALACFVGYYVVWRVTPALHSPLMSVTNAVSSVIIVGALIATGSTAGFTFSTMLGFLAVILASVNIFGGFIVTQRMLAMYKKKQKKA